MVYATFIMRTRKIFSRNNLKTFVIIYERGDCVLKVIKSFLKIFFVLLLTSCGSSKESKLELFVSGAQIAGVNGMHFGPDGFYMLLL